MRDVMREVIKTERLVMRPAHASDAEALFALFNNWNVVRWLATPAWPNTFEATNAYLERVSAKNNPIE